MPGFRVTEKGKREHNTFALRCHMMEDHYWEIADGLGYNKDDMFRIYGEYIQGMGVPPRPIQPMKQKG